METLALKFTEVMHLETFVLKLIDKFYFLFFYQMKDGRDSLSGTEHIYKLFKGGGTLRPFPYQVCAEGALLEQTSCGRLNPLQIVGLYNIYRFERHMSMHSTKKRTFNFTIKHFGSLEGV